MTVMLRLGKFGFGVDTASYNELERRTEANVGRVQRFGRNPALQVTGWSDTLTLRGTVYPHYRGGLRQIAEMRALLLEGEPLLLADSLFLAHGYWTITTLTEGQKVIERDGIPRRQDFELTLEYYGERPE